MIVTYLRSSSYTTEDWCQQKYFLSYVVGFEELSNQKADKGTIVHKALELLALCKVAEQNKQRDFTDDQLGYFEVDEIDLESAVSLSFDYYSQKATHHFWCKQDYLDCLHWTRKAVSYKDGMFDPRMRNIINPEIHFDFEIKQDWAKYDFVDPSDGTPLSGYLRMRGTVDLVTEVDDGIIEMIDWKTGRRLNWATGEVKDFDKLRQDPQLRIYHYAMSQMFPKHSDFLITIFFINDGGAFTIPFYQEDLKKTERMIQKKFHKICNISQPKLSPSWKCSKLCHFGKNNYIDSNGDDTGLTICEFMKKQTRKHGMDHVIRTFGEHKSYGTYRAPGT